MSLSFRVALVGMIAFCDLSGCAADPSPERAVLPEPSKQSESQTPSPHLTGDVLLAAGDIADCKSPGASLTATLLDHLSGPILAVGDLAYPDGSDQDFAQCYHKAWGRHKNRIYPVPGNHEYRTHNAAGYFNYFGERAHPPDGYYSFNLGSWHIIALNSNIDISKGSPQELWLRADLAANKNVCKLAFLHHPVVSSGWHGATPTLQAVRQDFSHARVSVVISGHDHHYERFAPLEPDNTMSYRHGTRFFVVGTGGAERYPTLFSTTGSEAASSGRWGVLKLTLRRAAYDWEWLPVEPADFKDSGTGTCATD